LIFILLIISSLFANVDTIPNPSSCRMGLVIPDSTCNSTSRFRIQVTNAPGTQLGTDVYLEEVRLVIAHTWLADLDIHLISPTGIRVLLTADNGADEDNLGNPASANCDEYLSFSASACNDIDQDTIPPFVGSYRPMGNFYDFNTGANPNGFWFLEICDDAGNDEGTLEFAELVFAPVVCLAPANVEVTDADTTAIQLDWEAGSTCQTSIIEYGPPGFTPGTDSLARDGQVQIAGCPPFTLTGLAPDTEYDVYIREYCGAGNFSNNSCPIRIRTGCLPPPATLVETFNTQTNCSTICGEACAIQNSIWRNAGQDNFDWHVNSGATPSIGTGPASDANGGGKYLYLETSGSLCRNGNQAILASNCIEVDASGSDSCHFSFQYHMNGSTIGRLRLQITIDGGETWQTIWEKLGNQGNRWFKKYVDLSPWDGQIAQFRFVGIGGSSSTGDIAVDNLTFYGSQDLGFPQNRFYVDADGDGFGNPMKFINSCSSEVPFGYSTSGDDCNDANVAINPGAEEIACNQLDENCNGMDDDRELPPPTVTDTTVCGGEQATVFANSPISGDDVFVFWYGAPTGDDSFLTVDQGAGYTSTTTNTTDSIVTRTVYAEVFTFGNCRSTSRAPAEITVNPVPALVTEMPEICRGTDFDLENLTIVDENNTDGLLSFHTSLPADTFNLMDTLLVQPESSTSYFLKSVNNFGCTDVVEVPLTVKTGAAVRITPQDTSSVCRGSTATLQAEVIDANTSELEYLWNTGAITPSITVNSGNNFDDVHRYILSATTPAGCVSSDTAWVQTTGGLASRSVTNVSTCGGNDGSISIEPLVGTPPFKYTWSGPQNGQVTDEPGAFTIENLTQGSYRIIIEDSSPQGCPLRLPFTLVNGPNAQVETENIQGVSCQGAQDGAITISVENSTNPLIEWSTGATGVSSIDSLSGGTYSVTVTEGACETILNDLEVPEPDSLGIGILKNQPSCHTSTNGSLDITAIGGTAPFDYQWEDGSIFQDRTTITQGQYLLTVTDANGCVFESDTIALAAPEPLTIEVEMMQDVSCNGLQDGQIVPSVTGGTAPYFYRWSNGNATKNQQNLAPGTYTLTVTDANDCEATQQFTIQNPSALHVQLDTLQNASCRGVPDGAIFVSAVGGTGDYNFQWSNSQTTEDLQNINFGTYNVLVTDSNGCQDSASYEVQAPEDLTVSINITEPSCLGRSNGIIDLTPNNIAAQNFNWNTGAQTEDLANISVGNYAVTITAVNGCIFDTTVTVTAPDNFLVDITEREPTCFNSGDGRIELAVASNNGLLARYQWNTGQTTRQLNDLNGGNYVATITDDSGCRQVLDTIKLDAPPPIEIVGETVASVPCNGDASGVLEVQVTGGVTPYRYEWSNGSNDENLYDLEAGAYRLTIVDENNCAAESAPFQIEEPEPLKVDFRIFKAEDCLTNRTTIDSLVLLVQGGAPPYEYRWNTGKTTKSLADLPPGTYSVVVKDANGCSARLESITVKPPGSGLSIKPAPENISCFGADDGSLYVSVTGGSAPFRYHFSNSEIYDDYPDTASIRNLAPGNYDVTVSDASGCRVVSPSYNLIEPDTLSAFVRANDIQDVSCAGGADGKISNLQVNGGTAPYEFKWFDSSGDLIAQTQDLLNVPADTYRVQIVDAFRCQYTSPSIVIRGETTPIGVGINTSDVACFGENSGRITTNITGGIPPYDYFWSYQNATTANLMNIPAGFYTLTITDQNGCEKQIDSIEVQQAASSIAIENLQLRHATCSDRSDGRISLSVAGGLSPYQIFWTSPDDPNFFIEDFTTLDGLLPGRYELAVTDQFDCQQVFSYEILSPDPIMITVASTPSRFGETTGSVTANPTGGTPPYDYDWDIENRQDSSTVDSLSEGIYRVTVTDMNGCMASRAVVVERDTATSISELQLFDAKIRLSPNPTAGATNLDVFFQKNRSLRVELYTLLGQRLWQQASLKVQQSTITLPVENLPPGTYLVQIWIDEQYRIPKKLIVRGK